jgi:hypothetical protein
MRDVKIGRVKGNVSISDGGGGGGGEALLYAVVALFVVVVVVNAALAIVHVVAMIFLALAIGVASLLGLAAVGGVTYVVLRLRRGQPLRRLDRPGRVAVIRQGRPMEITDARPRILTHDERTRQMLAELLEHMHRGTD